MKVSWEPFDAERLGYEALSGWLTEFYADAPWDEYLKCFNCSGPDDFGPAGLYSRPEVEAKGLTACPACGGPLSLFWSPERIQAHLAALGQKGEFLGFTALVDGERAAWLWGYEITEATPAPWGRVFPGSGMYVDRIVVLPEYRNGTVLWYLLLTTLLQLKRTGHSYILARTHLRATGVRTLMARLGFKEISECPLLPERSYWVRSLIGAAGIPDAA